MTIPLHLCVNDSHGRFEGLVRGVEVGGLDPFMRLHGPLLGDSTVCRVEEHSLHIGRLDMVLRGYQEWVGNWHWDSAKVDLDDAVRVVNYLRQFRYWTCEEAEAGLFEKWERGEAFSVADFMGVINGV